MGGVGNSLRYQLGLVLQGQRMLALLTEAEFERRLAVALEHEQWWRKRAA